METLHRADAERRAAVADTLARTLDGDPRIVFAYLHGSFVTDLPFHDIDVAVWLDVPAGDLIPISLDLAGRVSEATGLPADVRPLNDAPIAFRFHALRGRLLVCQDEKQLADVMERTVREYLDIEPLLRRATVEAFGG
jgi:predicted nucleotidyltransferase